NMQNSILSRVVDVSSAIYYDPEVFCFGDDELNLVFEVSDRYPYISGSSHYSNIHEIPIRTDGEFEIADYELFV
ncbi:13172_t:CDS:1, partial [Acaulospora colombiana]